MEKFIALCKKYFGFAMLFSFFINILQLTFSIYMLQVYDKVLTSYNLSTLAVITIAAFLSLATLAILEWIRSRLLIRAGVEFDNELSLKVFKSELNIASSLAGNQGRGGIRDVQIMRNFLGSSAVFAFFDIPWMPIYFILIFVLHPALGLTAVAGGCIVFCIGIATQRVAEPKLKEANEVNQKAMALLSSSTRNASLIKSMGMIGSISEKWYSLNERVVRLQTRASRRVGLLHSISKSFRLCLQVIIYAVGAYLTVTHQSTAGVMIAASIIMGRALSPIDQAMATYKQSLEARSSYKKIKESLAISAAEENMQLPALKGEVVADAITFAMQGRVLLQHVSFRLRPGTALAIIGPSASGKSTLCKLLLGLWPPVAGKVRLDGADIASWDSENLGKYIGYLPQDVELFSGSVAENIARMGHVESERVLHAARMAGVHELILQLPKGYDTPIGDFGQGLSGGQRQRIGLARALYNNPRVVVLDEPNSNLDEEGEARLMQCLKRLKVSEVTVILVAHKPTLLVAMDEVLALQQGRIAFYGPRDKVLQQMAEMQQKHRQAMLQRHEALKHNKEKSALGKEESNEQLAS